MSDLFVDTDIDRKLQLLADAIPIAGRYRWSIAIRKDIQEESERHGDW